MLKIGQPVDLAELAVADHVHTGVHLPAHDLAHSSAQFLVKSWLVDRLSGSQSLHVFGDLRRPNHAADMCRQISICATFHFIPPTAALSSRYSRILRSAFARWLTSIFCSSGASPKEHPKGS